MQHFCCGLAFYLHLNGVPTPWHRKWLRTGSRVKSFDSSVLFTGCVNEQNWMPVMVHLVHAHSVFSQIAQVRGLQTTIADCWAVFSDEFIKASSSSKCVFVAALPWSATWYGCVCLFYGMPQPLSSPSSLFILCSRMSFLQVHDVPIPVVYGMPLNHRLPV